MRHRLGRLWVHVLYRLHLHTFFLDKYPYWWRIPVFFGLAYLKAFMKFYR